MVIASVLEGLYKNPYRSELEILGSSLQAVDKAHHSKQKDSETDSQIGKSGAIEL
jgi:hypothetical protein